jgi:glycogen debranching enzyme GlgX
VARRLAPAAAMQVTRGCGAPLGASIVARDAADESVTVNFALHASLDLSLSLFLFPPLADDCRPDQLVTRNPLCNPVLVEAFTGRIRHVCISGLPADVAYAYKVAGAPRLLHDPAARFMEAPGVQYWGRYEGQNDVKTEKGARDDVLKFLDGFESLRGDVKFPVKCLSRVIAPRSSRNFNWGDDAPPRILLEDTVVYEAHVRGLTVAEPADGSVTGGSAPGTFAAAIARIPYLKSLGITALELLPIGEFNEVEMHATNELEMIGRCNWWGYQPVQPASFTPMARYGATPTSAPAELKALSKALHSNGMELIIDVVYNHVAGPSCSLHFLGVNGSYFITDPDGNHSNVSGCGNTLSPNSPAMMSLILDSMRHAVSEYHVDGFRLDAAGVFARDQTGNVLSSPPVLTAIAADPLLADVKIFVEPWDAGDGIGSPNYLNGRMPCGERYLEWNPEDSMRAVRRFVRGDAGSARAFCKMVRGCKSIFGSRAVSGHGSLHSVMYLAVHDGFSLADVVAYTKRTQDDGYPDDTTASYGTEGPTSDSSILTIRARQLRNMILALVLSRGTVMIAQGDECGVTKGGNNNTYDVDTEANQLPPTSFLEGKSIENPQLVLLHFWRRALALRRECALLRGPDFYSAPGLHFTWVDMTGQARAAGVRGGKKSHRRSSSSFVISPKKLSAASLKSSAPESVSNGGFVAWIAGDEHTWMYVAFNPCKGAEGTKVALPGRPGRRYDRGICSLGGWRKVCDTADGEAQFFGGATACTGYGDVVAPGGLILMSPSSSVVYCFMAPPETRSE